MSPWAATTFMKERERGLMRFSPANVEAAQLYKENTKEYERKVKVSLGPVP